MSRTTLGLRVFATSAAVILAATLFTACGRSSPGSVAAPAAIDSCNPNGVTVTVDYAQLGEPAVQLAKSTLEHKYPGLSVKLKETNITTYDQLSQAVVADIAAGSRPDVAMVGLSQVRFWVDQYKPQPLDTATLKSTYIKKYLSVGAVNGTNYVAPFQMSVPVLFTNATLAAHAGITAPPQTIGQLLADARKIKAATGFAPVQLPQDTASDWVVQSLVQSAGATYINPDGTAGFGTAQGTEAVSVYQQLGAEKLQDPISVNDARTAFNAGRIAYMVDSPGIAAATLKAVGSSFDWNVSAMPVPDGGTASLPAGGNGWMVLSQDSCKAAFSNALISEMLDPHVIAASAKSFSYIPVDTDAAAQLAADPDAKTQLGYSWSYSGTPTPWDGWPGGSTPRVNQFVQDMVQALVRGGDAATVVPDTVNKINQVVR